MVTSLIIYDQLLKMFAIFISIHDTDVWIVITNLHWISDVMCMFTVEQICLNSILCNSNKRLHTPYSLQ